MSSRSFSSLSCRAWLPFLLVIILAGSLVASDERSANFTYYADFETLEAVVASGDPVIRISDQLPLIDWVTFPKGKSGRGFRLAQNQWLRVALAQNLSFGEGSLSLWFQPGYTTPDYDKKTRTPEQYLFSFNTRTGDRFELKLVNAPESYLALTVGSEKDNNRTFRYPLKTALKEGEWYPVVVRWKRDNILSIEAAGQPPQSYHGFFLPDIPEEMGFDLFIGSNSDVLIHRRSLQNFDGVIDELKIADRADQDMGLLPSISGKSKLPSPPNLPWLSGHDTRRLLRIEAPEDRSFTEYPVLVRFSIDGAEQLSLNDRNRLVRSMRLVRYDKNGTPLPYETSADGEQFFHPFQAALDDLHPEKITLRFPHSGSDAAWYGIYYDPDADEADAPPLPLHFPMVGNGDKLRLGDKNGVGILSAGISGAFDIADLDGDGDWDIWANNGTHFVRRGFDLNSGHFYYDGLARQTGNADLLDSPRKIIGGNSLTGPISGTTLPSFGDLNGDGRLDILYLGRGTQEWWEIKMIAGKPEITKIHELDLTAAPTQREIKTSLYDYNQDGLLDIVVGFMRIVPVTNDPPKPEILHIYLNVGTATAPKFDNKNPVEIDLPGNDAAEWQYSFIDLDNDGDDDLLSAGFNTRFYIYKNIGTAEKPRYAERRELLTFDLHEISNPQQLNYARVVDWDHDGDSDIVFVGENTAMGFLENIAEPGSPAKFRQTVWLQQRNPPLDAGSLAIPAVADIDHDGDLDIIAGNSNPHLYLFENLGDQRKPFWGHRHRIEAGGSPIDLRPGPSGSVQSRHESDWGYNNPDVADWDHDGLPDIIAQGNRMDHIFFKNIGTPAAPYFARGKLLQLDTQGAKLPQPAALPYEPAPGSLITVHRSRPAIVDWDGDGLMDYLALDAENQFRVFKREHGDDGETRLTLGHTLDVRGDHDRSIAIVRTPPEEWKRPGYAGRTVINAVDWDNDGDYDLILNNVNGRLYENVSGNVENARFEDRGNLVDERLSVHNAGPEAIDWDGDGRLDLFLGTEEGHIYYFSRAYIEEGNLPHTVHPEQTRKPSAP